MSSLDAPARHCTRTRAGAAAFALGVHALALLAVLLSWRANAPLAAPPPAIDVALSAPPFVPAAPADVHRAGGSPASAPVRARPASPAPEPSRVPQEPIRPPAPVEPLPVPPPTLVAPPAPIAASPVTGAGASAATGASGVGSGSGPGGAGGARFADPDWLHWPGPEEVERAYPLRAYKAGLPGAVVLRCVGTTDGRVRDCRVLSETPGGEGFGRAALNLSRSFRFRPLREDGRPVEANLRIPIDFAVGDDEG